MDIKDDLEQLQKVMQEYETSNNRGE